jgi:class 3 adenylate cyclase
LVSLSAIVRHDRCVTAATGDVAGGRPAPLVGRRLELNWLRTRLDLTRRGFPHLVLVDGETGIGKSRLAQEFMGDARRAGMTVLRGRCYERFDLAYLPLREMVFSTLTEAIAQMPGRDSERELLHRIAAIDDAERAEPSEADERERTRQLLTLTRLVIDFARTTPTVVFVDDIDWADDATIGLLRHLLFRFEDERVRLLLLATSRGDAQARAANGVAALRREPRCATIRLHPLSELEATELARELGAAPSVAEARGLAVAGGGNPLLIHALATTPNRASWSSSADAATSGQPIMAAIDARLAALQPSASTVAQAAAFLVPHCTRPLLAAVTGFDEPVLEQAIRDAAQTGVLAEDGELFVFAHPVYPHAMYEETPPAMRRRMHRRIADALLTSGTAGQSVPLGTIAHHLIRGGHEADPERVADFARRAGDEAAALAAWSEATRCYEAALDAMDEAAEPVAATALHRRAALCYRYDLELGRAINHFNRAIELCAPSGDQEALAELYIWRTRCGVGNRRLLDVVADRAPLEQLVEELEATNPALAADGLVELSQSYWVEGQMVRAEEAARRAMALADLIEHHPAFARATMSLCVPQWARYDLLGSLATLEVGVARARMAEDRSELAGGPLFRLPLVLSWLGRLDEAQDRAIECCAIADEIHYPLETGLPLAALTQVAVTRGDFDAAERHAHQALLVQRLYGYHWAAGLFIPALVSACAARGRYDAGRDALDTWSETAGPIEAAAIAVFRRYLTVLERNLVVQGDPLPRLPREPALGADMWAAAMVEVARREVGAVDVRRAHDLLAEVDRRNGVWTSGFVALVPRVLGVAADLLGDEQRAIDTLQRAIAVAGAVGAEPEQARALLDLATIRSRSGERDAAHDLASRALGTFERLGMYPDADRAREYLGGGELQPMLPGPATPAPPEPMPVHSVILFCDVVDSTRLTEELGVRRYRERARQLEELVRSTIAAHGGTIVSGINLGDGFIGLFPSADRAVGAARRCARDAPSSTGLHLHLAVHAGDIIVDGARIFGGPVNQAARICSVTGPDEVLMSEAIHEDVSPTQDVAFVDRGEHALKGIGQPQRLYALVERQLAAVR